MLLILEDGEPARLHFAAIVHGTLNSYVPGHIAVGVACNDGFSTVNTKEGDLIDRESCQHSTHIRQPPPVLIFVVPTIHGSMTLREL